MRILVLIMLAHASCATAAVASGRNWRISIDAIECRDAAAALVIGARIRYLGPSGAVEAPLVRLADDGGRTYAPRSLAWKSGGKMLAPWLSAGGLRNIAPEDLGEVQIRFELPEASGDLRFEFGDIAAFPLTRKRATQQLCARVLKPGEISAPRAARGKAEPGSGAMRVYRGRYPCSERQGLRTVEAEHPPYAPRRLLLLGRGFLPGAREIELPAGKAPAQPYAYSGVDNVVAVEQAARRAIAADFPQYAGTGYFAFDWGVQKAQSGNEMYAIGVYELRRCARK